ncbi:MAG: hypothetical protein MI920_11710 [Kiloniellales bacterium]|nr:hypothetical protein [Kiloniellales bacterium]
MLTAADTASEARPGAPEVTALAIDSPALEAAISSLKKQHRWHDLLRLVESLADALEFDEKGIRLALEQYRVVNTSVRTVSQMFDDLGFDREDYGPFQPFPDDLKWERVHERFQAVAFKLYQRTQSYDIFACLLADLYAQGDAKTVTQLVAEESIFYGDHAPAIRFLEALSHDAMGETKSAAEAARAAVLDCPSWGQALKLYANLSDQLGDPESFWFNMQRSVIAPYLRPEQVSSDSRLVDTGLRYRNHHILYYRGKLIAAMIGTKGYDVDPRTGELYLLDVRYKTIGSLAQHLKDSIPPVFSNFFRAIYWRSGLRKLLVVRDPPSQKFEARWIGELQEMIDEATANSA